MQYMQYLQNLNWIDYSILIIFILSILSGLLRGFVKEFVSLVTIIAAFIVATMFASALATVFTNSASVQNAVNQASNAIGINASQPVSYLAIGLSFAILFIATIIIGAIISSILNLAVQTSMLGLGNRLLGGIFGLVRGFIITLVLIFLVQLTPLGSQPWWVQSRFVADLQPVVQWVGNLVSPSLANLKEKFGEALQNANESSQNITNSSAGGYTINNQ